MSHVADMGLEIHSLDALKEACKLLGLEFCENQTTFRWYGQHVGDWPLPAGFKKQDMGKCLHVIKIPNNSQAYQVGVAKNPLGPGYSLLWDFWAGGYGLQEKIGANGILLKQAYTMARTKKELEKKGYRTLMKKKQNGTMRLETF